LAANLAFRADGGNHARTGLQAIRRAKDINDAKFGFTR